MAQPEGMDQAAKKAFDVARNLIAKTASAGQTGISFDDEPYRALTHIPDEIAGIKGLTRIDLKNTKISDLSVLASLTGLKFLNLEQTEVSDLAPIADLTGLQSLRLSGTGVSDLFPIARLTGLQILTLSLTRVSDLSPIAGLTGLQILHLALTGVSDLSPIAGLTGLQDLAFTHSVVSDLSPIAGLTGLEILELSMTEVSDLSPIAGLIGLQRLSIDRTGVSDLRPLIGLTNLADGPNGRLGFNETPAVRLDDTLARLAGIEDDNQRAKEVLAYLKTLPPWPEPLPWSIKTEAQLHPQSQVTKRREEPPLSRSPRGIKTTPAQVKFILSQPRLTQFTAREVAGQIRFALADVKRSTNALPEPLATIEEIADALDEVGNMQLAPKQKQRVQELQLRIAHLEAVIERLTHQLNDADKARETADALELSQSFSGKFNPAIAEETAKTIGFVARTGVVGGAIYFLGATC